MLIILKKLQTKKKRSKIVFTNEQKSLNLLFTLFFITTALKVFITSLC